MFMVESGRYSQSPLSGYGAGDSRKEQILYSSVKSLEICIIPFN